MFSLYRGSQVCHETALTVTGFLKAISVASILRPQSHHQTFISVCLSFMAFLGTCWTKLHLYSSETERWHEGTSERRCKTRFHGVTPFLNHNTLLFHFFSYEIQGHSLATLELNCLFVCLFLITITLLHLLNKIHKNVHRTTPICQKWRPSKDVNVPFTISPVLSDNVFVFVILSFLPFPPASVKSLSGNLYINGATVTLF